MDKIITCGIYMILNKVNGKRYIGSAVNIRSRWRTHTSRLERNIHHSPHLQSSWNKYGRDAFELIIIEECCKDFLIEREQFYIDLLNPEYNMAKLAGNRSGVKHSDETKAKISMSLKGNQYAVGQKHTQEFKDEKSRKMTGNKYALGVIKSDETKRKISERLKGNKHLLGHVATQEMRDNISRGLANMSQDAKDAMKAKRSAKLMGNKNSLGYKHSQETKDKVAAAGRGRVFSKETLEKRSVSLRAAWARRKQAKLDKQAGDSETSNREG